MGNGKWKGNAYAHLTTVFEGGVLSPIHSLIRRQLSRPLAFKEKDALRQCVCIVMLALYLHKSFTNHQCRKQHQQGPTPLPSAIHLLLPTSGYDLTRARVRILTPGWATGVGWRGYWWCYGRFMRERARALHISSWCKVWSYINATIYDERGAVEKWMVGYWGT